MEAQPGVSDRRQRLLFPTAKGRKLALDLSALQSRRFERALGELPDGARRDAIEFLHAMIDPQEREKVAGLVWGEEQGRPGAGAALQGQES